MSAPTALSGSGSPGTSLARCDLIGDVHGQAAHLVALLEKLGYREKKGAYRHPDDRTAIFVGDLINRGPEVRKTLRIARAMADAGHALVLMGNHEFNAIAFATPDSRGGFFRPRTRSNIKQLQKTLHAFRGDAGRWRHWIEWFKTLPLFVDFGGMRVTHACWDERAIHALGGNPQWNPSLLCAAGEAPDARQQAAITLLFGPSVMAATVQNKGNPERRPVRLKWWLHTPPAQLPPAVFGSTDDLPDEPLSEEGKGKICGYPAQAPPVFFGHYGFPKPARPLASNVACLDLAVARGGPLAAYRWEGEQTLRAEAFVLSRNRLGKGE